MKRISYYLIVVVSLGLLFVGYWIYHKYFTTQQVETLSFTVTQGSIDEIVTARGEVAAQKDFNLEFPFSGTITQMFIKEGDMVSRGGSLVQIDTNDLILGRGELTASLASAEASLQKLIKGATPEDIAVAEDKVISAKSLVIDSQNNLNDRIRDAYTKSDDAIRIKIDDLFENPRTNPNFIYTLNNQQLKQNIEKKRINIEQLLLDWPTDINTAVKDVSTVTDFLDDISSAISTLKASQSLSQNIIDGYKTNITSARTSTGNASAALIAADEKKRSAETALQINESQLQTLKAPTRAEDIEIAKANIAEIENKIARTDDKIKKSTLIAPIDGRVSKVWLEKGEIFNPGKPVLSFTTVTQKIQTNISELDIRKIQETNNNDVMIRLDAYPTNTLSGKVISIDPEPIDTDGDIFYRLNISLPASTTSAISVRIGMSADLMIRGLHKENVLKLPKYVVSRRGQKHYVYINPTDFTKDKEVTVGLSDYDSIEIATGLNLGDKVYVKPN